MNVSMRRPLWAGLVLMALALWGVYWLGNPVSRRPEFGLPPVSNSTGGNAENLGDPLNEVNPNPPREDLYSESRRHPVDAEHSADETSYWQIEIIDAGSGAGVAYPIDLSLFYRERTDSRQLRVESLYTLAFDPSLERIEIEKREYFSQSVVLPDRPSSLVISLDRRRTLNLDLLGSAGEQRIYQVFVNEGVSARPLLESMVIVGADGKTKNPIQLPLPANLSAVRVEVYPRILFGTVEALFHEEVLLGASGATHQTVDLRGARHVGLGSLEVDFKIRERITDFGDWTLRLLPSTVKDRPDAEEEKARWEKSLDLDFFGSGKSSFTAKAKYVPAGQFVLRLDPHGIERAVEIIENEKTRIEVEIPRFVQASVTAVDTSGSPVPRQGLGIWAWGPAEDVDLEGLEEEPAFLEYIGHDEVRAMLHRRGLREILRMRQSTALLPVLAEREVVLVLIGRDWHSSLLRHKFDALQPELRMPLRPR